LRPVVSIRLVLLSIAAVLALVLAGPAAAERYVVLYPEHGRGSGTAAPDVAGAGGSVVASYPQIDVVIAESSDPAFAETLDQNRRVAGVASVGSIAATATGWGWDGELPSSPVVDADTFSPLQWYSQRISAPEAHAMTGGSPDVVVGVIDTGVDASHIDLRDNVDPARSASCVGGAPNQDPSAWNDDSGHGTNVAGVVGAAANSFGIVGIAPNVRLAVIKASIRNGASDIFLADAVICSYVWAAEHDVDVANSSFSVDSALSGGTTTFCQDDPAQRTVITAVRRAVDYAHRSDVSIVASAGNNGLDMADSSLEGCSRLPSGLPHVLTVSSIGLNDGLAAGPPSNFGLGFVDLAAPGGDFLQGVPPAGLVLGPWPSAFQVPRLLCDPCTGPDASYYRYFAGTSQAAAQVSGAAALVVSQFGRYSKSSGGWMDPDRVSVFLRQTADPLPCPVADARCVTDGKRNGFFGWGVVDTLRAVTRDKRA
jgi:lantibiotic leader peptide-processing serine protease